MTMSDSLKEELDALASIYCKPDEFQCRNESKGLFMKVKFEFNLPQAHHVLTGGIQFIIPSDYPVSCPKEICIFCDIIPESRLLSIKTQAEEMSEDLKGDCMLLNLVYQAQELLEDILTSVEIDKADTSVPSDESSLHMEERLHLDATVNKGTSRQLTSRGTHDSNQKLQTPHKKDSSLETKDSKDSDNSQKITVLLQLDHMRSKQNYVKLIQKWTAELGLSGRLLFYSKYIFILLQGHNKGVKDYIMRNKTMVVDVDSKGRPCKERMLRVLYESFSLGLKMFQDFQVVADIPSLGDIASLCESFSMTDIFKLHIEPICSKRLSKSSSK